MDQPTGRCVVGHCAYNPDFTVEKLTDQNSDLTFYLFPKTVVQKTKWIQFVRISLGLDPEDTSSWSPGPAAKICSSHFIRGRKNDDPKKSNFVPTIFPPGLEDVPPLVTYDIKDLVCWWVKNGDSRFPTLFPVVETNPALTPKQDPNIKSLTLVEVDTKSEPNPFIKSYIRVNSDMSFKASLRNHQLPVHTLLGEDENVKLIGSVTEFVLILEKLVTLNLCNGITTVGLKAINYSDHATVKKMYVDGKECDRLVAHGCEIVAGIKVCNACKRLWNTLCRSRGRGVENVSEISVEDKLKDCERVVENYKTEVHRLVEENLALKRKIKEIRKGGGKRSKVESGDDEMQASDAQQPPLESDLEKSASSGALDQQPPPSTIISPKPADLPPSTSSSPAPPQKVMKISKEQALLIKNLTSSSTSGNMIRVHASQLESIKKILGKNKPTEAPPPPSQESSVNNAPKKVVITVVKK